MSPHERKNATKRVLSEVAYVIGDPGRQFKDDKPQEMRRYVRWLTSPCSDSEVRAMLLQVASDAVDCIVELDFRRGAKS